MYNANVSVLEIVDDNPLFFQVALEHKLPELIFTCHARKYGATMYKKYKYLRPEEVDDAVDVGLRVGQLHAVVAPERRSALSEGHLPPLVVL